MGVVLLDSVHGAIKLYCKMVKGIGFRRRIIMIPEILRKKTTWAGLAIIVNAPLLAFGVPMKIVAGSVLGVGGLGMIFQRQATMKGPDSGRS